MTDKTITATLDSKKIDEIFAPIDKGHAPGAAVAVAIDGIPVYRKGFGLASLELPVMLSPTMRMRIGSTTKHFTCLAYMLLCEEGRAGLDDEIAKHVPELHAVSHGITMRHIMGHTSGLRDVFTMTMLFHGTGRPVTDLQLLEYYKTIDDLDFQPGTHWSYNNGGYMLLTLAIERISGESLDEFLRKRVFEPIGMNSTMMRRWDTDFVPNSATLHMLNQQGEYTRDIMGMEISGAGGIVSTMDDMLLWLKHMGAPFIGSAESWELMKTPHILERGISTGYGFGLISSRYRGVDTIAHAGGVMGGNAQMIKVPAAKLDITIATNSAGINSVELANQIIDACVEGLEPLPEKKDTEAAGIEQLYRSRRDGRIVELSHANGMQLVAIDGTPGLPMEADDEGVLRRPPAMAFMQQHLVPAGSAFKLVDFGDEDELEPVERAKDAKLGGKAGTYRHDILGVDFILSDQPEGLRMQSVGRHGSTDYVLEPVTETIWKAASTGPFGAIAFMLTFEADGKTINVTANRMANLIFRRAA